MDESDIERAINTETMVLASGLRRIQRQVAGHGAPVLDCEDCEHPIPPARLRAMPGATRCVDCQGKYEKNR